MPGEHSLVATYANLGVVIPLVRETNHVSLGPLGRS